MRGQSNCFTYFARRQAWTERRERGHALRRVAVFLLWSASMMGRAAVVMAAWLWAMSSLPNVAVAHPTITVASVRPPKGLRQPAIRRAYPFLSEPAFARKWEAATDSPLLFFRSFPPAFYRSVRHMVGRVPGGIGIVMGDAHPQNFGFIKTAGSTEYVFNDYDDSGRGPVALDALRYFSALRLSTRDKEVVSRLIDEYAHGAVKGGRAVVVPDALRPDWNAVHDQVLAKFTHDRAHFRLDPDATRLSAAPEATVAQVRSLVESDRRFDGAQVLDVALRARDYGGSAGLPRIWALVDGKGGRRILEFKQSATPAIEELGPSYALPPAERMDILKRTFLEQPDDSDLFSVQMNGVGFVVRDRSRMANVDPLALSKHEREKVFSAQVALMANVHHDGWAGVDERTIRTWLQRESARVAEQWQRAHAYARTAE